MESEVAHLNTAHHEGDYTVESVRADGTVVLKAIDAGAQAMHQRLGVAPVSDEEFERHLGDLPTGPA